MPTSAAPPRVIRQLPSQLVNQIAAGEVIERPASVVKELLENSIDAGASRIELTLEGGGVELIRISDNGCGMPASQLALAVTSHATSKLPDDDALFHVGTLGFRGEALASIASVSQMTIRSRPHENESASAVDESHRTDVGGSELEIRGGVIEAPTPASCPIGTTIEVRNLFFNTPVRRKFLKTPSTERGHIIEAFTRLALAHPSVHFVLRSGGKVQHDLLPTLNWAERIEAFFGGDVSQALISIQSDDPPIRIQGYVCEPSVSRGNSRMQYLFLNGRHIRDRALQHALGEAYRGLLMVGRHPICFLRMDMPADMIDVNVHPAKLEVRFTDSGRVYSRLLQTLRQRFLSTDMTHRVATTPPLPEPISNSNASIAGSQPDHGVVGLSAADVSAQRQSVIQWARGDTTHQADRNSNDQSPSIGIDPFKPFPGGPLSRQRDEPADFHTPDDAHVRNGASQQTASQSASEFSGNTSTTQDATQRKERLESLESRSVSRLGLQVHNRYLVTQDESGMVVIDQHALHERVLFERINQKVLGDNASLESQRLLVPEPVNMTPGERAAVLEVTECLNRLGLEIEDFGGESIVIHAVPAIMQHQSPSEMLRTLLEAVMGAGRNPNPKDLLHQLLATVACKAAVKAGDPLEPEEIESLLEQKDLYADTHHCPHGRPTALFFSRDELDRMFGRMGPRQANLGAGSPQ